MSRFNDQDILPVPQAIDGGDPIALAMLPLNDRGNAARFTGRFADAFRHVRGLGWHHYTGTHWTAHGAGEAFVAACELVADGIQEEAAACEQLAAAGGRPGYSPEMLGRRAASLKRWAISSGEARRCGGLEKFALSRLGADLAEFDAEPWALNFKNGTVRFKRDAEGVWRPRLYPHDPADLISRCAAVAWRPDAPAPRWRAHLERMMPAEAERAYLQRLFGYCASGSIREQCIFIFQGRGGDGKSTTVNTVRRVLGDYATAADIKTFLQPKHETSGAQATPDIARLASNVRLVSASEPPKGAKLDESRIKQVTGGASMVARFLNRDPFEFNPRFKPIIECNARPRVEGADDGIWRRIQLLLWRVQLTKAEMDPEAETRLVAEGEGVAAWIAEGLAAYLRDGLAPPPSVAEANDDYRRGSNVFAEWCKERLELDPAAIEEVSALYADYEDFCREAGQEPLSQRGFGLALGDMQIMLTQRTPGTRRGRRKGARLKASGGDRYVSPTIAAALDDFP